VVVIVTSPSSTTSPMPPALREPHADKFLAHRASGSDPKDRRAHCSSAATSSSSRTTP